MSLWVARSGKHGEHEQRFLTDERIYLTWDRFRRDLSKMDGQPALIGAIQDVYPDSSVYKARNHAAQMWTFAKRLQKGDWVIVPSKEKPVVLLGAEH